jgi:phosphatidylserine/phosphatidylglycerophosphate/cardiolipin synthase-like enzyme
MKRGPGLAVPFALALAAAGPAPARPAPGQFATAQIAVCFVPPDDCTGTLVGLIGAARKRVEVQAYELTSRPIIAALIDAHRRGVRVQAVLDRYDLQPVGTRPGSARQLAAAGIPVWIDQAPGVAHNKIMVIDDDLVVGGSFNYTVSAQKQNAENMTLTRSAEIAGRYLRNIEARRAGAIPFEAPARP